jgi:hypothetical protein
MQKEGHRKSKDWGEKRPHVFPTGISSVKLHHRAWVGGYVRGDQLGVQAVQAAIQEGLSVLFTLRRADIGLGWTGLSEGIEFNWRRWESWAFHL